MKALNELFQMIEAKKKKTATIDTKKFMQNVKKNNRIFFSIIFLLEIKIKMKIIN